jgi:hypothetical protein
MGIYGSDMERETSDILQTNPQPNAVTRVFKLLGSIRIAVVLILMLAAILATATYYESIYDSKTAQHLVYHSPFFAFFLGLLFVNIFCSTMNRFPWKRHQFGFVITHLGILILLTGSFITMMTGIDGSMALQEGQSSSRVMLDQPVFFFGHNAQKMTEIPAEFRWQMPTPAHPVRVSIVPGLTAVVENYYHHANVVTHYVADKDSSVEALQLRIFNGKVDVSEWLTFGKGDLSLGPAKVSLRRLSSPAEVTSFLSSKVNPHDRGELQLLLAGKPFLMTVSQLAEDRWTDVVGTDYQVRLKHFYAYAYVDNGKLVSRSDEPTNPAVEVEIRNHKGSEQRWLLFARYPQLNTRIASSDKGKEIPARLLYSWDTPESPTQHTLALGIGPGNQLYARADHRPGFKVEVGKTNPTGWMDLQFAVQQFIPKSKEEAQFSDIKMEGGKAEQNGPPPAVQVLLEGSPKPGPYWLQRGDVRQVPGPNNETMVFGYGFKSIDIGFTMQLKNFKIDYDPGTKTPAAFRSTVTVDNQDHVIEMNEPLVRNNLRFFQASYAEINGEPAISVLQVARDPGIWPKYLGSILLVMGIAIMFYMKPYQLKNRKSADEPRSIPARAHKLGTLPNGPQTESPEAGETSGPKDG